MIYINNVGIFPFIDFFDLTFENWRKVQSTNLDSMFLMSKALIPSMRGNCWGRVINISSSSIITAIPGMSHYMTSKMGVIGFTRGLANDVGKYGVTVNAVRPTLTQTPGADEQLSHIISYEAVAELQAIKKIGASEDIVGAVLFSFK